MLGLSIYEIFGSNLGNPQICSLTRNQPSYLKNKYPENILKFYRNFGNHNLHLFSFIMTNDTNYGIWNHKNLFYNPSPTYRVLPLQIWESKNKNYSSDGLRKSKQKCVNLGVKCWIWGKKILFWTFVSTWKLMKPEIRFDKRGPTNDVGLTCCSAADLF